MTPEEKFELFFYNYHKLLNTNIDGYLNKEDAHALFQLGLETLNWKEWPKEKPKQVKCECLIRADKYAPRYYGMANWVNGKFYHLEVLDDTFLFLELE